MEPPISVESESSCPLRIRLRTGLAREGLVSPIARACDRPLGYEEAKLMDT